MPLLIREDLEWSDDGDESREYRRIARNWNAIHRAILSQPYPCFTTDIDKGFFFIFEDELLFCSGYAFDDPSKEPHWDLSCPLYNFDGQGAEDLADLSGKMESWLKKPSFVLLPDGFDLASIPDIPSRKGFETQSMFYLVEV
jgi:hypothetical protein